MECRHSFTADVCQTKNQRIISIEKNFGKSKGSIRKRLFLSANCFYSWNFLHYKRVVLHGTPSVISPPKFE